MKSLVKLAGGWKQTTAYWFKAPFNWTKPGWMAVRRVFIKVNGLWKRIYIRNAYAVYALGLLQQQVPNAYGGIAMNSTQLTGKGRSYNLVQLDKNGELTFYQSYDIFADGNAGTVGNIIRMANDLNEMVYGQIFIIYSFDEPMAGHHHPVLVDAVERVGGVPGVYSQQMAYRGAYMLLGKVGFPNYFEKYVGTPSAGGPADGDPAACIVAKFTVVDNVVLLLSKTWGWGQSTARDVHTVYALGGYQIVYDMSMRGVWTGDTARKDRQEILAGRSYNLTKFSANNAITTSYYYDVYADQVGGVLANTTHLMDELNSMPDGQVFVLFTFDEPSYGHTHQPLVDAVLRVGGTQAIYGQPMGYRGAYMLIGKVGSPAYYEYYIGVDGDPFDDVGDVTAAIKKRFFVENNEVHFVQ